jgi:hypothetical protein
MPGMRREVVVGGAMLCLLTAPLVGLALLRPGSPRNLRPAAPAPPLPPSSAFESALAEAGEWRQRAAAEVRRRREELEGWDSATADPGDRESVAHEAWRLQQLATDEKRYLHRAQAAALDAVNRAQTPREKYRAASLLAAIEHERGHHDQELQQARTLVALQPRSELSLMTLRRAAICTGQLSQAAAIDTQLAALRQVGDGAAR